jgi:lipopolysaccharide/colanic/teichoic acid biosynthesis glycosyltransferase
MFAMLPLGSDAPPYLVYSKNMFTARARRLIDVGVAANALALLSPVMAVAALAVFLEDGKPVLFAQRRVGQYERLFTMWKLRTMQLAECDDRRSPTSATDPRVTRVGRVLRRLSIDELPQLFNVVRGDMSLVGPRPEMPFIVARYESWQHLRHLVRPGITCFWQVRMRSTVPLDRPEASALDVEYVRCASALIDCTLLFLTILAIVRPKGAY